IEALDKKEADNLLCEVDSDRRLALKSELDILDYNEARYWSQRAKKLWIKDGDESTPFFHKACTARQEKDLTTEIMDEKALYTR
ncbi:hypothetical protein Csa_023716, partial [Cucumis sativus]